MKRIYTIILSLVISVSAFPQSNPFEIDEEKMRVAQAPFKTVTSKIEQASIPLPEVPIPDRDVNIVSVVDIGTSANAFTYWEKLSYLFVNPDLNTVTNLHRMGGALDMGGSSGDLGYDISKDGGQSWENMIEFYIAGPIPGEWFSWVRYPQGGIFNPAGNTDPDEAYLSYFSPCLYNMPPPWTHVHGVANLGDTSYHTDSFLFSDDRFPQYIPSGYTINSEGNVFVIDAGQAWTNDTLPYRDSLLIYKGVWNEELMDFTYDREMLEAYVDTSCGKPLDARIAFGPDGQTGYIVMIASNGMAEQVEGFQNLYPIYWKTEDGGESWNGPEYIQIDGPLGMNAVVNHQLTDEQIAELFGPNPPARTEISYTTAYDCDISVDYLNRLHIAVVIGPTGIDPYSIITAEGYLVAYDLFEENPSNPFCAVRMGSLRTFRGYIGDDWTYGYDNRIQITMNPSADKIFVSWLDTDLEGEDDNNRPNIWVRGFDPFTFQRTMGYIDEDGPTNVTLFSEGMWQAHLFAAPKTAFEENGTMTIPYVFVKLDTTSDDPMLAPIQFKYIQDFSFNYSDFINEGNDDIYCGWVGIEDESDAKPFTVSGNMPNPFHGETTIQIELSKASHVGLTVFSITGQQICETTYGRLYEGKHQLTINMAGYSPGIYMYTVTAGQHRLTKKMVVE